MIEATSSCTGCGACQQICPVKAVKLIPDKEGFLYPSVDIEKCIKCNLCEKCCPIDNLVLKSEEKGRPIVLAAQNREDNILLKSTSGGAFAVLAKYVLSKNGIVFGACMNEKLECFHTAITDISQLKELQGSKYVQSATGETFLQTKQALENGRIVLYSGTPCQIGGLKCFLKKKYENLITVDIVCHGVPNQCLFDQYIEWKQNKMNATIDAYIFREKERCDWNSPYNYFSIYVNKRKKFEKVIFDPYYWLFLKEASYRESCYQCAYANDQRVGDITIADFWGVEKFFDSFDLKRGVSLILLNTEKGKVMLEYIKENMYTEDATIDMAKERNKNLSAPTSRPEIRSQVYNIVAEKGIDGVLKLMQKNPKYYVAIVKSYVPVKVKAKIKRFFK